MPSQPAPAITALVWWMTPDEALARPRRLLAQVMALGLPEHVAEARRLWPDDEFRAVLRDPPPGVFDRRSWAYWHTVLGMLPIPALPRRRLPGFP